MRTPGSSPQDRRVCRTGRKLRPATLSRASPQSRAARQLPPKNPLLKPQKQPQPDAPRPCIRNYTPTRGVLPGGAVGLGRLTQRGGGLHVGQTKLGESAVDEPLLVLGEVALGFFLEHADGVDGVPGQDRLQAGLAAGQVGYMPQVRHGGMAQRDDQTAEIYRRQVLEARGLLLLGRGHYLCLRLDCLSGGLLGLAPAGGAVFAKNAAVFYGETLFLLAHVNNSRRMFRGQAPELYTIIISICLPGRKRTGS
ncbi:hypothetical protein DFAR_1260023 [Desulfarculales bacterium]